MKIPPTLLAVPILVSLASLTGCIVHIGDDGPAWGGFHALRWSDGAGLDGDGIAAEEERTTSEFDRVEISGAFTVRIGVGGAAGVRLAGDSNLLEHVSTRVEDGLLEVRPERSLAPVTPLVVEISLPSLAALALSGASDAELAGFDGGPLELALSGSNEVVAVGRVDRLVLGSSGSQSVDLSELVAREAEVSTSGSARLRLNVEEHIALSTSGSSSIELRGGADLRSVRQSGRLDLDRVDD